MAKMRELVEQRRARALECAQMLLRVGTAAGRDYVRKPITDDVENYHIEWLNCDLLMDLVVSRTLPASDLGYVRQAIDDGCLGISPSVESGYHRIVNLYEAGVEITGLGMDLDAAEAELAKKTE